MTQPSSPDGRVRHASRRNTAAPGTFHTASLTCEKCQERVYKNTTTPDSLINPVLISKWNVWMPPQNRLSRRSYVDVKLCTRSAYFFKQIGWVHTSTLVPSPQAPLRCLCSSCFEKLLGIPAATLRCSLPPIFFQPL